AQPDRLARQGGEDLLFLIPEAGRASRGRKDDGKPSHDHLSKGRETVAEQPGIDSSAIILAPAASARGEDSGTPRGASGPGAAQGPLAPPLPSSVGSSNGRLSSSQSFFPATTSSHCPPAAIRWA